MIEIKIVAWACWCWIQAVYVRNGMWLPAKWIWIALIVMQVGWIVGKLEEKA